jgi:hypothetical protein
MHRAPGSSWSSEVWPSRAGSGYRLKHVGEEAEERPRRRWQEAAAKARERKEPEAEHGTSKEQTGRTLDAVKIKPGSAQDRSTRYRA